MFGGVPTGDAKAQLDAIKIAIRTAFGGSTHLSGQCNTYRAQQSFRSSVGHELSQHNCQTEQYCSYQIRRRDHRPSCLQLLAINLPAPSLFIAFATGIIPANKKMVTQSMELYACFSVMQPCQYAQYRSDNSRLIPTVQGW